MEDTINHTHDADTLLQNVRDLLVSRDPTVRVRAAAWLAEGVDLLERRIVAEAHKSGLTWAQIGGVYGVTRQAVHRRFSDATVLSGDGFEELLADLASKPEVVPTLSRAASRARQGSD